MDFFESQDVARKKTGLLIFYFVLAVIAMIIGLYLVWCLLSPFIGIVAGGDSDSSSSSSPNYSSPNYSSPNYSSPNDSSRTSPRPGSSSGPRSRPPSSTNSRSSRSSSSSSSSSPGYKIDWWQPGALGICALVTLAIIGLGSLYKITELRGGGAKVAELLGGRRIHPNTRDPGERRLINVVEEMSLASGTPVPPVYVMDHEEGINAFAAGYTPSDAVIGVTRGLLNYLTRDELQGVIAHEFSHILNGDMRLNIRLMGVLNGILIIAIIGLFILRYGWLFAAGSGRSRGGKKGGGGLVIVVLGMGFAAMIIGFTGMFFARLIKAAVSRQREYLADASAVQFTRNPDGIGGALKKIGGLMYGSRIQAPEAESCSHMFFSLGVKAAAGGLSTHPPLPDRIKRIDPNFDGKFPKAQPYIEEVTAEVVPQTPAAPTPGMPMGPLGPIVDAIPIEPVIILGAMGEPTTGHVEYSHDLLTSMPQELMDAIHDLFSSRAVVFALLLDDDDEIRRNQFAAIQKNEGAPTEGETMRLWPLVKQQGAIARLPIIEMVQSTLSEMSIEQYKTFHGTVDALVIADGKIDLFEFMLQRVLLGHLDRVFHGAKPPSIKYHAVTGLIPELVGLISTLAHVGHDDEAETNHAFDLAMAEIPESKSTAKLMPKSECSLKVVSAALDKLGHGSPSVKKKLLSAAMVCIGADGKVTVSEAELVRAIADSLDCPIPPIAVGPIES